MTRRNITRDFSRLLGLFIGVTIVTEVNIAIYDARLESIRDRLATGVSRGWTTRRGRSDEQESCRLRRRSQLGDSRTLRAIGN